jgi:hypothetical protein
MPASRAARLHPAAALAATALAAVALAGLAGCGSSPAPGSAAGRGAAGTGAAGTGAAGTGAAGTGAAGTGAAGAGSTGTGPATPGCTPAGLRVRLDTTAASVAAGTYYVPLEFTNTTSAACALTGYPAVALTSGVSGNQIGTEAALDRSVPASAVTLAPGATAHAWLGIASTAGYPARTCKPVTAAGLRVVVPGSETASYLADRVPACKHAVPGSGILVVRPVQPGPARRGTA